MTNMTPAQEKIEFNKMTDKELVAYHNICIMSSKCIMSREDREINQRHLGMVKEILKEREILT
jgi:hypothetical protein